MSTLAEESGDMDVVIIRKEFRFPRFPPQKKEEEEEADEWMRLDNKKTLVHFFCVLLSAQKCVSLGRPMMWEMRVSLRSDDEHPSRRLTCALSFFSFKKR